MLSKQECDIVKHLHDAGKGGIDIARIIDNRRAEKMLSESDVLTDVMEHIYLLIGFCEVGI